MKSGYSSYGFLLALIVTTVGAHPGHDHMAEAAIRSDMLKHSKKDLSHCAEHLRKRGHAQKQIARRMELARSLRLAQGIEKRDLSDLNRSHYSTENFDLQTPPEFLFTSNNSCVLSPEVIEGPYYVAGEFVRNNIVDGQEGVPLFIDTQVIDIDTCEPIPNIFMEIWSFNSTGIYSGVVADGNGDSTDESNLDETFLRGIQPTDDDGISLFRALFPGHYAGRTTHIHIMAHINATMLPNGTVMNTVASHVGQMFFDQDLINEVEELSPYTANTQALTTNADDEILAQEAATSDPMMEWVTLGESISDGILAWLAFGVNTTFVRNVTAASFFYKEGGVTNPTATFSPP